MYSIDELVLKNDSNEEQIRTRVIFEDIRERIRNAKPVSEHEKDFFFQGVKISVLDDGELEDYPLSENFCFKMLYLTYYHNLSGLGVYEKLKDSKSYMPSEKEVEKDIRFLDNIASNWKNIIERVNHSDELLNQISKETRAELKEIEQTKGHLLFKKDRNKYTIDKKRILLQNKYIYCKALLIFEMFEKKDFILNINSAEVEINEYSIIHILSRHFSEVTKQNFNKSYHGKDITPEYLNKQLKDIFEVIEDSRVYCDDDIKNINFQYKGINYAVWINERTKSVKGKGNILYNRLETFYPIEESAELKKISDNYNFQQLNDEIGVYIKKSNPAI